MALRIHGNGIRPSNSFYIDGQHGHDTLYTRTGNANTHAWGQRSLVAGIATGIAGGLFYGLGKVEDSDGAVVSGLVGMAVGGALIAIALPVLGLSKTTVRNAKGDQVGRIESGWVW